MRRVVPWIPVLMAGTGVALIAVAVLLGGWVFDLFGAGGTDPALGETALAFLLAGAVMVVLAIGAYFARTLVWPPHGKRRHRRRGQAGRPAMKG